jgi:hypothetical protein
VGEGVMGLLDGYMALIRCVVAAGADV